MKRYLAIYISFIMLFGILCVRLFYLSYGVDTNSIIEASGNQYSRKLNITSRRGFIYDRNGIRIAGSDDGYITVINPSKLNAASNDYIETLIDSSGYSYAQIVEKIRTKVPFKIYTDKYYNDDIAHSVANYSRYITGTPAAHIIGYINSDGNGVIGAEYYYNDYLNLTGGDVYATYQADGVNNMFGGIPFVVHDNGYSRDDGIVLTLDIELQADVEELWKSLELDKGAIVIADIATGEILVSASFPTFNAYDISAYLNSNDGELINRCAGKFTPGSVFKIITSCAALEIHSNYLYSTYECTGEYCYFNTAHGIVNMAEAFAHSCNGYFYELIETIGVERLQQMAEKFGIGQYDYIDFLYTGSGMLDMSVARNAAIGQGGILCSPYEITRIICTVMNDGYFTNLCLFKGVYGNTVDDSDVLGEQVIKKYTASVIKRMMYAVVTDGIGQNAASLSDTTNIGGKTSSAQSGQYDDDGNEIVHSWFAGYYHGYAITVLCENSKTVTGADVFAHVTTLIN